MAQPISKPLPPSDGIEHRKSPRKQVLLTSKIVYGDGAFVFDCTIRDISATGARITLAQGRTIPDEIYLLDMSNRMAYQAKVVSERASGFGLKFLKAMKLSDINTAELRYLKRIWMEHAR